MIHHIIISWNKYRSSKLINYSNTELAFLVRTDQPSLPPPRLRTDSIDIAPASVTPHL